MVSTTPEENDILSELGRRLRARRLQRNEKQLSMAARIGVSAPTYRKMEQGDPTTALGYWVRVIRLLGDAEALQDALPVALFELADSRKRAGSRRK